MDLIELYRNKLHFSAPRGWINDPNGFSYYRGIYHLFYQHNPDDTKWGPMLWGHAISTDLLRWRHLPVALAPGESYDRDGCYSGSAAEHDGRHVLMYTGNREPEPGQPQSGESASRRQVQCIAIGDGERYEKLPYNPVIGSELVPEGSSLADFRDPKLWKDRDGWHCLVAGRSERAGGQALLYASEDLEHWRFVGLAAHGGGTFGTIWECPDFFPLEDREVLIWSVQSVPQEGCSYQRTCSSVYSIGALNRTTAAFEGSPPQELDLGPDFYAPQTVRSPDGRRILIAWMQAWGHTIPTDELHHGWAGSMTLPRELAIVDGELIQRPVRELNARRRNRRVVVDRITGEKRYPELDGHYLDLKLSFTAGDARDAREFGVAVKCGSSERTVITYSVADETLSLDRSRSGRQIRSTTSHRLAPGRYCCDLKLSHGALELRIILDRSSCEVFAAGGRRVMSASVFPADESVGVCFFAAGGEVGVRCEAWDLSLE